MLVPDEISEKPVRIIREKLSNESAQKFLNLIDFINKGSRPEIYSNSTNRELVKHMQFIHSLHAVFISKRGKLIPLKDKGKAKQLENAIDSIISQKIIEPLTDAHKFLKKNQDGKAAKHLFLVARACIEIKILLWQSQCVEIDYGKPKEKKRFKLF